MAVSTLLGQARAGHAAAIAQLMNQQLQSRGVRIQASREGNCLRLRLEGQPLLAQSGFVAYVEKALGRLGCPVIERVEIAAVEWGESQPLWQSSVTLVDAAAPLSARVAEGLDGLEEATVPTAWRDGGDSVKPEPEVKRSPLPSRGVIAMQWFVASLWGTLATLGITAALSALLIPVVASMTGMEQLSGFALVILLAIQLIIGIPVAGLVIGYAQTRMLRHYLRTVGGWLLITPLGCLIGFFIGVIVHFVGHSALSLAGWANSLGQAEGLGGQLISLGCTTLGVGLGFGFLGLAQFAVLTGRMRHARRWIGMMGLSGVVAWLVAGGLFKLMLPTLDDLARMVNMTPMLLGGILAAIAAWFVFQSLSSWSLAMLLRPRDSGAKLG